MKHGKICREKACSKNKFCNSWQLTLIIIHIEMSDTYQMIISNLNVSLKIIKIDKMVHQSINITMSMLNILVLGYCKESWCLHNLLLLLPSIYPHIQTKCQNRCSSNCCYRHESNGSTWNTFLKCHRNVSLKLLE